MRHPLTLALLTAMLFGLGQAAPMAADYVVVLEAMKFGAVPVELHVGDTITWKNDDIFRHTATARDKSFDIDLPANSEVQWVITTAGDFDFFCKFHPGMTGTLVVQP